MAVGVGIVATSSNGTTWAVGSATCPVLGGGFAKVCAFGRLWVLCGIMTVGGFAYSALAISSDGGATWSMVKQTGAGDTGNANGLQSNGNQVVAVCPGLACASLISGA